jgi:hypothetical protein
VARPKASSSASSLGAFPSSRPPLHETRRGGKFHP